MKKYIVGILLLILIIACGKEEEVVEEEVLRPVKYQKIEKTDSNLDREFSGTIKAEKESKLSFRVGGTIERKYVSLGEDIQKGEVLAELDRIDYEVTYQGSLASLEQTRASLIRTKADYERNQKLYFNDNVSKADYETSLANYKSAKAQEVAAQKQAEYDRLQLSYTRLVAPAGGSIAEENSEENETVSAGTPVYTLSLDGALEVEFFVPESLIAQIYRGEKIQVDADVVSGKNMEATVVEVGRVSTGFGNTFPVKAKLESPSEDIKSGMTATVKLQFKFAEEDVIILPLESVVTDSSGVTYVYALEDVANKEGTVKRIDVVVGKVTTRGLEVLEGLTDGDLVITAGMSKIAVGQKVEVPPMGGRN